MTEQELQEIDAHIASIREGVAVPSELSRYCNEAFADRHKLLAEVRRLRAACKLVVEDYDKAKQEKYDELCWDAFGGVDAIREKTPAIDIGKDAR